MLVCGAVEVVRNPQGAGVHRTPGAEVLQSRVPNPPPISSVVFKPGKVARPPPSSTDSTSAAFSAEVVETMRLSPPTQLCDARGPVIDRLSLSGIVARASAPDPPHYHR